MIRKRQIQVCEQVQLEITVYGRVQGVGFRPFVAEQAEALGIAGTVRNSGGVVRISASGTREALDELVHRLLVCSPRGSRVDHVEAVEAWEGVSAYQRLSGGQKRVREDVGFSIIESEPQEDVLRFLPPDIATCERCVDELYDPSNRRYRYPFISCTSCGPRFSIMEGMPYDRDTVTMRDFVMCRDCTREYTEPGNVRRHAQTIACEVCGPRMKLYLSERSEDEPFSGTSCGVRAGESAVEEAIRLLREGRILAIKDIGGYHFAFDPNRREPAGRLRAWKHRDRKPFAVMFGDAAAVEEYCELSETERKLLSSDARPIVLLKKKRGKDFVPEVCGQSLRIGAFLPCNPLQHLIVRETGPLVMTSGNRGGEPIITEDSDMLALMAQGVPDAVLAHDRRIRFGLDDSVCQVVSAGESEFVQLIRRARGTVPEPVRLPVRLGSDVFAAGGDLKAVFALGREDMAYLSGHFGDLDDVRAAESRREAIARMKALLGIAPVRAVCDRHPGYVSSRRAAEDGLEAEETRCRRTAIEEVQHHHAHIAAVIAEHALRGPVLGVAYDGTGFGDDGTIWGGEFLLCEGAAYKRVGQIESVRMTGGDSSSRDASLTAFCYLHEALGRGYLTGQEFEAAAGLCLSRGSSLEDGDARRLVRSALEHGINTVRSSSMGRLFDAAAAILGVCNYNSYEGECPQMLQDCAERYLERHSPDRYSEYHRKRVKMRDAERFDVPIAPDGEVWIADTVWLIAELAKRRLSEEKEQGGFNEACEEQEKLNEAGEEQENSDEAAEEKKGRLAYEFHVAVARMTIELCGCIAERQLSSESIRAIALGGGSMYNSLLLKLMIPELQGRGYEVCLNEKVPSGDGGLAYGQMYLTALRNE